MVVVDFAEGVFHLGEGAIEDGAEDAVLLVGEEGGEGVADAAKEAFEEVDHLGEIGAADSDGNVVGEGGEGEDLAGIGGVKLADGGGEVLVAEVEDGIDDLLLFLGDSGAELGAADGEAAAAGGEELMIFAADVEAEDFAELGVLPEDGADGVVRTNLFKADAKAEDAAAVDLSSVAKLGDVAFGAGEDVEEGGFEGSAFRPKRRVASWRTRPA